MTHRRILVRAEIAASVLFADILKEALAAAQAGRFTLAVQIQHERVAVIDLDAEEASAFRRGAYADKDRVIRINIQRMVHFALPIKAMHAVDVPVVLRIDDRAGIENALAVLRPVEAEHVVQLGNHALGIGVIHHDAAARRAVLHAHDCVNAGMRRAGLRTVNVHAVIHHGVIHQHAADLIVFVQRNDVVHAAVELAAGTAASASLLHAGKRMMHRLFAQTFFNFLPMELRLMIKERLGICVLLRNDIQHFGGFLVFQIAIRILNRHAKVGIFDIGTRNLRIITHGILLLLGCRPNPPEGFYPSDSLLRFATV